MSVRAGISTRVGDAVRRLGPRRSLGLLAALLLVAAATGALIGRGDDDVSRPERVPAAFGDVTATVPAAASSTTTTDMSSSASAVTSVITVTSAGRRVPGAPPAAVPAGSHQAGSSSTTSTTSTTASPPTTSGRVPSAEHDPPYIGQLRAGGEIPDGPDEIFDDAACGATSIRVEAVAFDQSGIRSATLYWSFAGAHGPVVGSKPMAPSGGRYRAVFGPFPPGTAPGGTGVLVAWWVEATDNAGNTARADAPASAGHDERIQLSHCAG